MEAQEPLFDTDPAQPASVDAQPLPEGVVPLAERMRPRTLDEVTGQAHLLGPGKPLRVAFESGAACSSMILWGPPGWARPPSRG